MTERDVIWITLESVRWDHTTLAAHSRNTTPNLSTLSSSGHAFEQCYSHDIWTRSSTASILTGYAPSAHRTWSNAAKLPESIRTIPEAFGEAGYRTVGISPNGQFSPQTGLDRGFDRFHHLTKSSLLIESWATPFLKWLGNLRRHSAGLTRDGNRHCLGYLCNGIAKQHIDRADDEPLFLYLHHGDSHHAYVPPIAWRDHFASELPVPVDDAIDLALDMSNSLHEHIATEEAFTEKEWETLEIMYDTSIAYVDHLTGTLIEYARQQLHDPIVVVTGDHGELFGEQGLLAHMLATNTAVSNVPLVVTGLSEELPNGLVQHSDVMRMICADLNIDHPVPIGRDIRTEPRQFAITQRGGTRAQKKIEKISSYNESFPGERFPPSDLTSLRTDSWRFDQSDDGVALFAIGEETVDVSHEQPSTTAELREHCESWLASKGQPVGDVGTAEFDDATRSQLQNLGYI